MARKNKKQEYPEGNIHRKNFVELLNKLAYDRSRWNVFTDFLQIAAITLSNVNDPAYLNAFKDIIEERNKRCKSVIDSYRKDSQELFQQMLYELVEELETYCHGNYTDVLGEVFHDLNFQNEWQGQFFTPQNVATMAGMMLAGGPRMEAKVKQRGFVTFEEPCCGGGAMIYGFAAGMYKAGFNPCQELLIVARDLDERCVLMTFIQCSLYGLPAIVMHQNTLVGNVFNQPWYTPIFITKGWHLKALDLLDNQESNQEPQPKQEEIALGQISLF